VRGRRLRRDALLFGRAPTDLQERVPTACGAGSRGGGAASLPRATLRIVREALPYRVPFLIAA